MSNPIHSKKNAPVKAYGSGDMHNLASLAECDMQWMSAAIEHVRKEVKMLDEFAGNGGVLSGHHLSELLTHLDMYEYIAASRLSHYSEKTEVYEAEFEANKKAVSL